ncbi:PRK06851 family protein [Brevibacillus sp. DP1.3A]|uniref:PRK06851 family protein n=1 Tax=Brevibacillus sp. DP1.3A TaxID=2738867 RepID=UPI00156AB4AA|nr:PRK06851 family protein [Brevibacillus sp. DP1.3A]UED73774.1 PRK06851 family protein [Brevibacillus sp. DP1.3A]
MTKKVRHIYAAGNTARGYKTFYDSVLEGLERVYILTGTVEGITSPLIESIGNQMARKTDEVEWIHSPFVNGQFDGVIFPRYKVAIMDGSYPRLWRPASPGVTEIQINLQAMVDVDQLVDDKDRIAVWYEEIFKKSEEAYQAFGEALRIHDEWEAPYIENLDREEANLVTKEVIGLFFRDEQLEKKAKVRRMYLGAATPQGPVDHIIKLTDQLEKRYFIKGRPGSGKSTMLKKLVKEAQTRGFDVEVYHCGLDPHSLDMVIVPEKSLAIFDSTAPHEYFPSKDTDEVIDMYERAITPGTDEKYEEELLDIKVRYTQKIKEATANLVAAKELRDQLNTTYQEAVDQQRLKAVSQALVSRLTKMS